MESEIECCGRWVLGLCILSEEGLALAVALVSAFKTKKRLGRGPCQQLGIVMRRRVLEIRKSGRCSWQAELKSWAWELGVPFWCSSFAGRS